MERLKNSTETDPWKKYAGTDYHQNAIDAAKAGDMEGAYNWLGLRDEKTVAQGGDNRGKSSLQIYNELLKQYGTQTTTPEPTTPSYDYDYESRPTYSDNGLSERIDQMLNEVLNRDAFSYNVETDPLYQQYKTQYQREGSRAMNDALAAAASGAGGMNSYAMTAANQANNYYNAQLTDKIPELYQLAYEMYLKDIDQQVRDLGLLQDMDDSQYNRYRDTMSDWQNDRDFAYDMYRDDVLDNKWQTEQNNSAMESAFDRATNMLQLGVMPSEELLAKAGISAEQAESYIQNGYMTDLNTSAQKDAHNRVMEILGAGGMPSEELLNKAGMTTAMASSILAANKAEQSGGYTGGSTPTGGGSGDGNGYTGDTPTGGGSDETGGNDTPAKTGNIDNDGMAEAKIKAMQKALGVAVDGKWGPKSQAAAKEKGWGTSASDAWKSYTGTIDTSDDFQYLNDGHYNTQEYAADAEVTSAIYDLGLGPVNEDTVWQIMQNNGIVEKDGKFVWANGWNKNNWQDKLAAVVKTGSIGLFAGAGAGH